MPLLVDEAAESLLGPWGIAIGAGVGLALLARKRLRPAASAAVAGGVGAGVSAGERAREWVTGFSITDRAKAAAAEVGDWWSDLYAEAQAEWSAGRNGAAVAAVAATAGPTATAKAVVDRKPRSPRAKNAAPAAPANGAPRRGPDGRFLKRSGS